MIVSILQFREPQPRDILNCVAEIILLRIGRAGIQIRQLYSRKSSDLCVLVLLCPKENML